MQSLTLALLENLNTTTKARENFHPERSGRNPEDKAQEIKISIDDSTTRKRILGFFPRRVDDRA
jgi:hypothetical protein